MLKNWVFQLKILWQIYDSSAYCRFPIQNDYSIEAFYSSFGDTEFIAIFSKNFHLDASGSSRSDVPSQGNVGLGNTYITPKIMEAVIDALDQWHLVLIVF